MRLVIETAVQSNLTQRKADILQFCKRIPDSSKMEVFQGSQADVRFKDPDKGLLRDVRGSDQALDLCFVTVEVIDRMEYSGKSRVQPPEKNGLFHERIKKSCFITPAGIHERGFKILQFRF